MWFKNLRVYLLRQPLNLTQEALEVYLQNKRFQPCGRYDVTSLGWDSPLGRQTDTLVHELGGCQMICARQEDKLLPSSVVNEIVDAKLLEIEQQEGRKVRRKERTQLREDTFQQLLPQAFSRYTRQYALIDKQQGWIMIDAASANKAEAMITLMRETLETLPVKPLQSAVAPAWVMTEWLKNPNQYKGFTLLDSCELKDRTEESSVVRCKGQDLTADEILAHLEAGKEVVKLAVQWDEHLSFLIESDLSIKRLKFLDLVQEQTTDHHIEGEGDLFDSQFTLMSLEFRRLLPRLFELFGGIADDKND
jgi:recombination associated protein RdgC